ncbi:MAG: PKD domain-containing protein [Planctomycetota bacterium]|jgi:hypothetical protein
MPRGVVLLLAAVVSALATDHTVSAEYAANEIIVKLCVDADSGNIVVESGRVPVADAGSSRYAGSDPVQLDGTGSYDPDHSGALGYQWHQVSGPTVVITDADKATPTISGFTQTGSVQQCQFELVVSDGDLTSLPDTVEVIIVPSFSGTTLVLENPPFDPDKPSLIFFAGGSGGGPLMADPPWEAKANIISFSTPHDGGKFAEHGNAIITYLSSKAPNYNQPIQTTGHSNGGKHPAAVGAYLNMTYADRRYNVNQATLLDAHDPSLTEIEKFLNSSVDGEQSWVDNYRAAGPNNPHPGPEIDGALNVCFPLGDHSTPTGWYTWSINPDWLDWMGDVYNGGIVAGAYLSIAGEGKNLELAPYIGTIKYYFQWHGPNWGPGFLEFYDETSYPGRLPEPVTLVGPNDGDFFDANGVLLSCEESENAVGYQLLMGSEPYRVADYNVISDTPYPPNEVITTIPFGRTWWTVRAYDQYGSTIYADPQEVRILKASNPRPADGARDVARDVELNWSPGFTAASHDLYLGTSLDDVANATTSSDEYLGALALAVTTYDTGPLEMGRTYYWRVDEQNPLVDPCTWKGDVWEFEVKNWMPIDDFEPYPDDYDLLGTWTDGGFLYNGAIIGLGKASMAGPVHEGAQSLFFLYDNKDGYGCGLPYYSEAYRGIDDPCDWDALGVDTLTLYFYGDPLNEVTPNDVMYVGLEDGRGAASYAQISYPNMANLKVPEWRRWDMPLADFTGVQLNDVAKLYIGFGNRAAPALGGFGLAYFDDIRIYIPEVTCPPCWDATQCHGDTDDTGDVKGSDFLALKQSWYEVYPDPLYNPCADFDRNGEVKGSDFLILKNNWYQTVEPNCPQGGVWPP